MVMEINQDANNLIRLKCSVQTYDWGRIGNESLVANIYDGEIDENKTYAELWMGTHDSGPSFLVNDEDLSLKDWIKKNPDVLGDVVVDKWGVDLPFMFKVNVDLLLYRFVFD
jgi:mannose-6-phosphate isomerase